MIYRLVGETAMVVHFLVLVYMAFGGFLAWRWPRAIWPHAAIAAWGLISVTTGVECPLTIVENWGRHNAGLEGLRPSGFIDHYIEGVVYPEEYTTAVRWAVAAVVLSSWAGFVLLRRRARTPREDEAVSGTR
ncbi:hypothetical protein HNP84_001495 [Thermocatellispora tengchongensis]|uniref:DUF2784 domain-containing protein n=1 Tax=Thermocatellispora tengchongensis TaxID=1073253 RepID=A0A840NX46_9ACTN|nr:DUF2784 domain-containing protein [Thermocatellispora tengchongensis]MBB5131782.1 hypothetical protein [Thermocatellispora tengchongensis]